MNRRQLIALAIAITLAADAALAQSASAKATVDAAKARGAVGEQGDGYLGFVSGSADPAVKAAVDEINEGRSKVYRDTAAKTGVTESAAGQATALQLFARLPAGYYYRPVGVDWTRK